MATGDDLYQMTLTGQIPPHLVPKFEEAKAAGNASFSAGDYESAVRHYKQAAEVHPMSAVAHSNCAMALLRLRRFSEAVQMATDAVDLVALHPEIPNALSLTIKSLLRRSTGRKELHEYELAQNDLEEVLVLEPGHAQATTQLRELRALRRSMPQSTRNGPTGRPRGPRIVEVSNGAARGEARRTHGANGNGGAHPKVERMAVSSDPTPVVHSEAVRALALRETESPPSSAAEFERAWRTLRTASSLQRTRYMAITVGAGRANRRVVGQFLTSELLMQVCDAFSGGLREEPSLAQQACDVLHAISKLPRFDLAVMFLSDAEKSSIQNCFSVLKNAGVHESRDLCPLYIS